MALWQFITFTALVGALLVYASIITRRLGRADARLNRIEEALLARSHPIDSHADTRAAEAKPEGSGGQEPRKAYLTLRDLRAGSEQLSSRGLKLPTMRAVSWDAAATTLESRDPPATSSEPSSEPLNLPAMRAVVEDSAATSLDVPDAPATTSEPPSPPDSRPPSDDDSIAKKNRDTLLFLSNQRRRRRARLGY